MGGSRILVTGAMGSVAKQLMPALEERYRLRLFDRSGGDDSGAPLTVPRPPV